MPVFRRPWPTPVSPANADRDLFTRVGPAPDMDRLVALQHHVGLENIADAQPLTDRGHVDDVLPRHRLGTRGRREQPSKSDGCDQEAWPAIGIHQ